MKPRASRDRRRADIYSEGARYDHPRSGGRMPVWDDAQDARQTPREPDGSAPPWWETATVALAIGAAVMTLLTLVGMLLGVGRH